MELRNTLKTQHGDIKLVSHVHVLVSECIKSLKQSNISMQAHEYAFSKKKTASNQYHTQKGNVRFRNFLSCVMIALCLISFLHLPFGEKPTLFHWVT